MKAGVVTVSPSVLLEMLKFESGTIKAMRVNDRSGNLELFIEHPEMPETEEGKEPKKVFPRYSVYDTADLPDQRVLVVLRAPIEPSDIF